ncbi:hypothetical protein [Natronococcus jeotgali]|uniref:hypothetical protein n=1 Tax=Natronococcus jeotgali TaxID=413812 RepID=UPI001872C2C7|nr:hypothetical protein [Natronococcus jeotgali]
MDERFENPSDEAEDQEPITDDQTTEPTSEAKKRDRETTGAAKEPTSATSSESSTEETETTEDEPLNIRDDWDSATLYVEPEQSEDIEVTFTRLKKQLKREGVILEKNKHFYRAVFEIAFDEHREETKEKIRELAKQDENQ